MSKIDNADMKQNCALIHLPYRTPMVMPLVLNQRLFFLEHFSIEVGACDDLIEPTSGLISSTDKSQLCLVVWGCLGGFYFHQSAQRKRFSQTQDKECGIRLCVWLYWSP